MGPALRSRDETRHRPFTQCKVMMRRIPGYWIAAAFVFTGVVLTARVALLAQAQQVVSSDLDVIQVRPNFYMIAGAGANIAVQVGPIGAIVVDTGSQQVSDKVVAAVRRLTDGSIRCGARPTGSSATSTIWWSTAAWY
jgi:hypothetical protein